MKDNTQPVPASSQDALERCTMEALKRQYSIKTDYLQWDHIVLPSLSENYQNYLSLLVSWSKNKTTNLADNFESWALRHLKRV